MWGRERAIFISRFTNTLAPDHLRSVFTRLRLEPWYAQILSMCLNICESFGIEIFLPSYVECDFESLERKRDPVHEITLSDEEIKAMFPQ